MSRELTVQVASSIEGARKNKYVTSASKSFSTFDATVLPWELRRELCLNLRQSSCSPDKLRMLLQSLLHRGPILGPAVLLTHRACSPQVVTKTNPILNVVPAPIKKISSPVIPYMQQGEKTVGRSGLIAAAVSVPVFFTIAAVALFTSPVSPVPPLAAFRLDSVTGGVRTATHALCAVRAPTGVDVLWPHHLLLLGAGRHCGRPLRGKCCPRPATRCSTETLSLTCGASLS